jgi:hypothetical protein
MTIHLSKFIERVQGQQARGAQRLYYEFERCTRSYTLTLPDFC